MTICVNQSGTWRNISTICTNDSGNWRNIGTGCINDSGTWRRFLDPFVVRCPLGSSVEGGFVICKSSNVAWIVAPAGTEVSTNWSGRNSATTSANNCAACGDWFVPTCGQLQNPGYTCRTYWDSFSATQYWSSTSYNSRSAFHVNFTNGTASQGGPNAGFLSAYNKPAIRCVRAFRCVTY